MRREYAKQQNEAPTLSLDFICDSGDVDEAAWLADSKQDINADTLWAEEKAALCNTLTVNQLSIFNECLIGGKSQTAYAADHGISVAMVSKQIRAIREKAKKYFSEG